MAGIVVCITIAYYSIKIALLRVLNLLGQLSDTRSRTFTRTCNQCQQKEKYTRTRTRTHLNSHRHAAVAKGMCHTWLDINICIYVCMDIYKYIFVCENVDYSWGLVLG